MEYAMWFLLNIWIPAQMCVATNGAYLPSEAQAQVICAAILDAPTLPPAF